MMMMRTWLVVMILLCFFIDVHHANPDDFYSHCRSGDYTAVKGFLDSGKYTVTSRDAKGNTGIIIAAGRGQIEIVKMLLSYGASAEDYSTAGIFEGKNALHWAASQGRAETVAILVQSGANPQKSSDRGVFAGKNALMWASSQGRYDVVKLLLSAGVDPNFTSNSGSFKGKTSLMW